MIKWPDGSTPADPTTVDPAKQGKRGAEKDARAVRLKFGHVAPDRLKGRYATPGKPLLTAEVKPQTNTLPPFELTD